MQSSDLKINRPVLLKEEKVELNNKYFYLNFYIETYYNNWLYILTMKLFKSQILRVKKKKKS